MRRRIQRSSLPLVALAAVLLAAAGCGDIADMLRLSAGLRKFGEASVKLTNRRHLTVTFESSPAAGGPDEGVAARHAAEYVRGHYPKYRRLEDVTVEFPPHVQYGTTGFTRSAGVYTFTRAELTRRPFPQAR